MNKKPIGVFDSGVGGLTVVKEIMKLLPEENIVYLGDTANLPYGDKSEEIVKQYSVDNTDFLLKYDIKVLVVACNTASSVALSHLKQKYTLPIIGVIEPAAKGAANATRNSGIGVIGTNRTIKSNVYADTIRQLDKKIRVFQKPCPLFVPLIEENFIGHPATKLIAEEYLKEFADKGIDTMILGCTHYPLIMNVISLILPEVKMIDSASSVAKDLQIILEKNAMRNQGNRDPELRLFATDITDKLNLLANRILDRKAEFSEIRLKK